MHITSRTAKIAAIVASGIFGFYMVFELMLALGAPWGRAAWGGQFEVLPIALRVASIITSLMYAGFAILLLSRAGLLSMVKPGRLLTIGPRVLVGLFALSILMNAISPSPIERWHAISAIVLLMCCWMVALSPERQADR